MNLLPEKEKAELGRERLRRLLVVILFLCAGIMWFGTILLLPSYFFAEYERREFARGLEALKSSPEISRIEQGEQETEALAQKFLLLEQAFTEVMDASQLMSAILAARPSGISILDIGYINREKSISLRGRSQKRSGLLEFARKLEEAKIFEKVSSPVSNFLKDENVEFTLSIELAGKR